MTRLRPFLLAILVAGSLSSVAAQAEAATFLKGFADGNFADDDAAKRALWQDESVRSNTNLMRFNLSWKGVTGAEPADPTNPADPSYDFAHIDRAVIDATARGQTVLLTVFDAPEFASG